MEFIAGIVFCLVCLVLLRKFWDLETEGRDLDHPKDGFNVDRLEVELRDKKFLSNEDIVKKFHEAVSKLLDSEEFKSIGSTLPEDENGKIYGRTRVVGFGRTPLTYVAIALSERLRKWANFR